MHVFRRIPGLEDMRPYKVTASLVEGRPADRTTPPT